MSAKGLLQPLAEAAKLAKGGEVEARLIHEATAVNDALGLVHEAKAVGLSSAAQTLERATGEVAAGMRRLDVIEQRVERAVQETRLAHAESKGQTLAGAIHATAPNRPPSVNELFAKVPFAVRVELVKRAARLMRNRTAGEAGSALKNMAGQVREVLVKHLPELHAEVETGTATLRSQHAGRSGLTIIDTGFYGEVELAGIKRGGNRSIGLGTDRIIGTGRLAPELVKVRWRDEAEELIVVAGRLDVTMAIEVKGASNAFGGVGQLRRLGRRAEPGYIIIDNHLWLLGYEPSRVTHVLVAPVGAKSEAAREVTQMTAAGLPTRLVTIPTSVDADIITLARAHLVAAAGR